MVYNITAVLWLIACAAWFALGYAVGGKRGRRKGVKEGVEAVKIVYSEAYAADENFVSVLDDDEDEDYTGGKIYAPSQPPERENSYDCERCCYKASPLCKECIVVHSPSGIQKPSLFVRVPTDFKYFQRGKQKLPDVTIQEALMNESTIPLEVLLDYNFQRGKLDN